MLSLQLTPCAATLRHYDYADDSFRREMPAPATILSHASYAAALYFRQLLTQRGEKEREREVQRKEWRRGVRKSDEFSAEPAISLGFELFHYICLPLRH